MHTPLALSLLVVEAGSMQGRPALQIYIALSIAAFMRSLTWLYSPGADCLQEVARLGTLVAAKGPGRECS